MIWSLDGETVKENSNRFDYSPTADDLGGHTLNLTVTDWKGGDCSEGGRVLAAGDPRVPAEALALLRGVAE